MRSPCGRPSGAHFRLRLQSPGGHGGSGQSRAGKGEKVRTAAKIVGSVPFFFRYVSDRFRSVLLGKLFHLQAFPDGVSRNLITSKGWEKRSDGSAR
jgi:hypothetical protein